MRLIHGDCVKVMTTIEDNSIDLTVTSPPYDNLRTYNGNNSLWGEHVWKAVIKDLYRVTKDGGVVVWVVGDATIKGSETGTRFKQALFFKEIGFNLHDTMIWEKPGFANPSNNRHHQVFEYMFIFSKGAIDTFNPIKDRKNKWGAHMHFGKHTGRNKEGVMVGKPNKQQEGSYGMRFNVWKMNTASQENVCKQIEHPATFPEQLANNHIISWSNEGDTVLDPFMGSGTTGRMAKQLNRDFIGIELDEKYFNIAKSRINGEIIEDEITKPDIDGLFF